jgi:hypothetical protein
MLILNCTKAAADFFSTTKKGKKISVIESAPKQTIAESIAESMANSNAPRQWQWLVHAIKVKGKHVLIAMDYQSRFSITLSELKKGDDSSFLNDLEHHLTVHVHETMTAINADSETIDTSLDIYRHQHHSRAFYLRGDRSVQAHINDVAWHFGRWADEMGGVPTEVDLISFDVFANQMLRKRKAEKDYFTPQREFLRGWLTHYGAHSTAEADECIDRLNAKERADSAARYPASMPSIENKGASLPSEAHPELGSNVISLDAYRKKNG